MGWFMELPWCCAHRPWCQNRWRRPHSGLLWAQSWLRSESRHRTRHCQWREPPPRATDQAHSHARLLFSPGQGLVGPQSHIQLLISSLLLALLSAPAFSHFLVLKPWQTGHKHCPLVDAWWWPGQLLACIYSDPGPGQVSRSPLVFWVSQQPTLMSGVQKRRTVPENKSSSCRCSFIQGYF